LREYDEEERGDVKAAQHLEDTMLEEWGINM